MFALWHDLALYVAMALGCWRYFAGAIAWLPTNEDEKAGREHSLEPDWSDGIGFGLCGAIIWPIVLVCMAACTIQRVLHLSWPIKSRTERLGLKHQRDEDFKELERKMLTP